MGTVQVEVCEPEYRRYCDKLTKDVPFPVERQNCHFERKKICQLVPKTKPKKAKVYSYTEDCKEIPREICDQCETKTLQPACLLEARMIIPPNEKSMAPNEEATNTFSKSGRELQKKSGLNFLFWTWTTAGRARRVSILLYGFSLLDNRNRTQKWDESPC